MNRHNITKQNLEKCTLALAVLKLKFPSEIGPVTTEDTVVPLQKNSSKLNSKNKSTFQLVGNDLDLVGFYQDDPFVIFIAQKFLLRPLLELDPFVMKALTPRMLKEIPVELVECCGLSHTLVWDDWAILEIIAHEAAHGGTRRHGLLWRKKYLKFLKTLFDLQISGRLKLDDEYFSGFKQSEDLKA